MTLTHPNHPQNTENVYSDFKIFGHTDKLAQWQKKGFTEAPVILDLDLTDRCKHKCPMCLYNETNTEKKFIKTGKAKEILTEAAEIGSRAVTFAGGGDPTCHSDFEEIILHARSKGLDVALFSNAQDMSPSLIRTIAKECTWMNVSLDADGPEIYKKTHGMSAEVFEQATNNIRLITKEARETGSQLVVRISYLIGPQSIRGIYNAAALAKNMGAQAIRLRPFFNFGDTRTSIDDLVEAKVKGGANREDLMGEMQDQLARAKQDFKDNSFDVSVPTYRIDAMVNGPPRGFPVCYYPHFSASITADGKLYPCCPLKGYPEYEIGDLTGRSFKEVWNSPERRKVSERVDFKRCPNPCQFDGHARKLMAIKGAEQLEHTSFL